MMINVIVPVTENVNKFVDFIKNCSARGVKFYVGTTQNHQSEFEKMANVEVFVFKNNSNREEIINSMRDLNLKKGKILVVRRPLSKEEFSSLVDSGADLCSLKKPRKKFSEFFKNLVRKIVSKIFAFTVFDDISAICYGEFLFEFMSVCPNLSMASRINKYVGVEFEEIETQNKPAKTLYSRWLNMLVLLGGLLFFFGSLAGGILIFVFVKNLAFIFGVLIVFWWVVAFTLLVYSLLSFVRTIAVGKLRYKNAEMVSKR